MHNPDSSTFETWKDRMRKNSAAKAPNVDIKVMLGATRPATALHAPTTVGTLHFLKGMVPGLHLLRVSQHPQHNHRHLLSPLP